MKGGRVGLRSLLFILFVLVVAGISPLSNVSAETSDGKKSISVTYDADDSLQGRVYNLVPKSNLELSVPFVQTDTTAYPKKFGFSPKRLLSNSVKSVYPRIVARDSLLYVTFSVAGWAVYRTWSNDYGRTWTSPSLVETTGAVDAGHPCPVIIGDSVGLSYSCTWTSASYLNELVYRNDGLGQEVGPRIVLRSTDATSQAYGLPSLLDDHDTLRMCFQTYMSTPGVDYLDLCGSANQGAVWFDLGRAGTTAGAPFSLTGADEVLSIVHRGGSEVVTTYSLDGGLTWSSDEYVSTPDGFASQLPHSATDGCCTVHAGWYDFDGAPAGWYGYIYYRRSIDGGRTWEPVQSLSTAPYCQDVVFWADSQRVYAVWNDCRENGSPDFALYMRYSHDNGATWSTEQEIVDKIDPARRPDLYGQGDLVYLVWEEQHPPDWIWGVYFMVGGWYTPGDIDRSNEVNVSDLTFLVSFLFQGGLAPVLYGSADADGSGDLNVSDLTYFVAYLFAGGPPPIGAP